MGMYEREMVQPFIDELLTCGFEEFMTVEDVDKGLSRKGYTLVVVNSVCGCGAAKVRPGVIQSLNHEPRPANLFTVFAGLDMEATARVREYFKGYPPSSPSVALLKNGEILSLLERHMLEAKDPEEITRVLKEIYDRYCASETVPQ